MKEKTMEFELKPEVEDIFVDKAINTPPVNVTAGNKNKTLQRDVLVEDEYLLNLYREILEDIRVYRI